MLGLSGYSLQLRRYKGLSQLQQQVRFPLGLRRATPALSGAKATLTASSCHSTDATLFHIQRGVLLIKPLLYYTCLAI